MNNDILIGLMLGILISNIIAPIAAFLVNRHYYKKRVKELKEERLKR